MHQFNEKIKKELIAVLEPVDSIIAAWEGGSIATGFDDDYSDLDLGVMATDGNTENVFVIIDKFLEEHYGISHSIRMPEPTWHGMSQCFYFINGAPEFYYIDLGVMHESIPDKFMEEPRHGTAIVWFDKKGVVQAEALKDENYREKRIAMYKRIALHMPLIRVEFFKNAKRGRLLEAYDGYSQMMTVMIGLMNLKYRPEKFDFRSRYIYRDYPADEVSVISSLVLPQNFETLKLNGIYIEKRIKELLQELKPIYG